MLIKYLISELDKELTKHIGVIPTLLVYGISRIILDEVVIIDNIKGELWIIFWFRY